MTDQTDSTQEAQLDPTKLEAAVHSLFGQVEGAFTCALAYVGDRLGLFAALDTGGASSSIELAERTGLDERWVREWLRQQCAAGMLLHDDGAFSLSPEAAELFAREDGPYATAGVFQSVVGLMQTLPALEESFRTGRGAPYDAFGEDVTRGIERMFAPFFRTRLVPEVLPSLDGVVAKLEAGAKVADLGCGTGVAILEMAKAFPASEFHGYDSSRSALDRAAQNLAAAGVTNVTFHDAAVDGLAADASHDLVTTFDCLHDMTDPRGTIDAIRKGLKPDGTWFASDIRGHGSFQENLAEQPFAGMLYGFSVTCCMRSALATDDGAGLGTLGFSENVARAMAGDAGFTKFEKHDFEDPLNDYYEVRI